MSAETLTYMNLNEILEDNGITVKIGKFERPVNYENCIKVYIKTEDGNQAKIAGSVDCAQISTYLKITTFLWRIPISAATQEK